MVAPLPPGPPDPPSYGGYADSCLAVLDMLSRGQVHASFDATREDVTVPESLRRSHLVLKFSWPRYSPGNPIYDLNVDLDGFRGTFSFGGQGQWVEVPWAAIYAVEGGGRQVTWHERIPLAIRGAIAETPTTPTSRANLWPTPHRRPTQVEAPEVVRPVFSPSLVPPTEGQVEPTAPTGSLKIVESECE